MYIYIYVEIMNDHVFQIYIIVYRFTVRWFGDTAILGGIPDDGNPKIFRCQDENQKWKSNGCHNMPNKQNKSWKCMSKYFWIRFLFTTFLSGHSPPLIWVCLSIQYDEECHPVFVHMVSEMVRKSPTESMVIFSAAMLLEATPRGFQKLEHWEWEQLYVMNMADETHSNT